MTPRCLRACTFANQLPAPGPIAMSSVCSSSKRPSVAGTAQFRFPYSLKHCATLPPPGRPANDRWRVKHVTGDLFSCPRDEALAHCISEDCRMGAGIAVLFKKNFRGVEELKSQKRTPGQCAVLKRDRRFVYYLITKKRASQKPTYESLRASLEDMRSHCVKNGVTRISMPCIGCGLDRLKWDRVSEILEGVFEHTNISVTVYSLPAKAQTTVMKKCKPRSS